MLGELVSCDGDLSNDGEDGVSSHDVGDAWNGEVALECGVVRNRSVWSDGGKDGVADDSVEWLRKASSNIRKSRNGVEVVIICDESNYHNYHHHHH
ncbi:hypothetical protein Pcinc_028605 [Petrolisthes cinctipes]|uniref:Uncharacterized protein n=1 Tax=Petrolisthes cinctipes TaxID=88211 RepID=A0AAE1F1L6_PETCI|nr:hypothetical protein Pcinc_028605 [Petrolisthes cinctipes]